MEWRIVKTFPKYEVSTTGIVRTIKTGKVRKPWKHKGKWLRITLFHNGRRKNYRVHRLVAEAFIGNPEQKPEVNHKDCNPENNNIDNLEWVTTEENILHYEKFIRGNFTSRIA